MGAEADALCGAGYGERSTERTNQRNGYRHRQFDTRTGSLDLAIPKLRQGSYFPDWLLERRKRAERALTTVVATCYLLGVSTRRMDKLVETLGITSLSKSQVSVMAKELDTAVEAFRTRPPARPASDRRGGWPGWVGSLRVGCWLRGGPSLPSDDRGAAARLGAGQDRLGRPGWRSWLRR